MSKRVLSLMILGGSLLCGTALAAEPTTPAKRTQMIQLINSMEAKPYGADAAVHTAGVEGVLKFYDAMKAQRPGVSIAPIEKIARAKADGKLDQFVTRAMARCN
jgi:hypothetical protein